MINKIKAYTIINEKYITEKTNKLKDKHNVLTLKVKNSTNKIEIKKIIENIFNIKVKKITIINIKSKNIKFKNINGKTKKFKKALITLEKNKDINFSDLNI